MAAAERKEIIKVNFDKLYKTINDFEAYPSFSTGVKEIEVLESTEKQAKVHFNIEMIKQLSYIIDVQKENSGTEASVSWTLAESDFLNVNNGGWHLKKIDEENTEVTYSLEVEFKFPAPSFIVKNLVKTTLPTTIKEFVQRSHKA